MCSATFWLVDGSMDPGTMHPSAFKVDPSPAKVAIGPTKLNCFVSLVDTLLLSNPKPILQLEDGREHQVNKDPIEEGEKEKHLLWDYLEREIKRWDGEVVTMGDFNEVRHKCERLGSVFNASEANVFNSFIVGSGLAEVVLGGRKFTWCHKSRSKMSKLDRNASFDFRSLQAYGFPDHHHVILHERELPLHHPSWRQMPPKQKAGVVAKIGTQFDLRPHMESNRWPQIYAGIQQHLQKIYNGRKAALKQRYWLAFWNDPKNLARAAQNKQNRANSKVVCRQGSRSIAAFRDMHMETSATREYPSLIYAFFMTHTVGGLFLDPEDKALYDEMLRLQGLGSNTPTGVPYTEDEIMAIVRGGKQRGHIPGVGRVLPGQCTVVPPPSQGTHLADIDRLKKREKLLTKEVNMFKRLFRSDDRFSQMLTQLESQPDYGGGSGSGGCGDDEPGDDEDDGEEQKV
uniref:RNA-directed DNA polymerase, eukaryota n=1 Tax=Tanacetum cinerariifolium TaxID=118510 RepID=A0A6L2LXG0_TANCI|nr:hypothetical protein [Tanacetum cinerariifolium]